LIAKELEESKKPTCGREVTEEKKWKVFLIERAETMVDGVFGLVLGLGAYSLTGFTIREFEDVMVAISYFTLTFFLVCMFWWDTSKRFIVAEYSDVLMAINFFFIVFLVLMPFSLKLMFFLDPNVKSIGMTMFPIIMGVLMLFAFLANVVVLYKNRGIPAEVRGDLKRGLFLFPLMIFLFFCSLSISPDDTTQMYVQMYLPQYETIIPDVLGVYPFRVTSWWLIIILMMMFGGLIKAVQKKHACQSEKSSPKKWRVALTKKCRVISDSVYGLALGLCAYSLTDYAIKSIDDMAIALSFFFLTLALVATFWMEAYRAFGMVPFFDNALVITNFMITFFVALMPFSLRLVIVPEVVARNIGMSLFPLNMTAASAASSVFIALSLHRRTVKIPKDDLMELKRFPVAILALAFVYIASFWIPPDATIPSKLANFIPPPLAKGLPFRVIIWWLSFPAVIIVMGIVEMIQEAIERRKNKRDLSQN